MHKANLEHMLKTAQDMLDTIKAQMEEPEERKWIPKVGELCEIWDGCDDEDNPTDPRISRFHHFDKDGSLVDMNEDGGAGQYYDNYRKLQTPATRREHDGGERCPVDGNTKVVVDYGSAKDNVLVWSNYADWSRVVAYWVLEN